MCKCIRYWVEDSEVKGSLNRKPVSCNEYIAKLEAQLQIQDSTADSTDSAASTDSLAIERALKFLEES